MNLNPDAINRNRSDNCYRPPMVSGLVWRSSWGMPFEGPLTLLWKIAVANVLTPQELCKILFRKKLLSNDANGIHGRSLLVTRWMADSSSNISDIGNIVRHSGLDSSSARWATILASDSRIRYCELCMSEGYQSVFCQIDGLLRCPIHNVQLIDSCQSCGCLTPRYSLSTLTMSSPFCCHSCGESYGGKSPFLSSLQLYNPEPAKFNKYDRLGRWFSELDKLELLWPQLQSWQCCAEGKDGDKERRIAIFGVLNRLIPIFADSHDADEPSNSISIFRTNLMPHRVSAPRQTSNIWNVELSQRKLLYLAIRRHIRRSLKRHHRNCLNVSTSLLHIEWENEVLYGNHPLC